jgi:hypothetical protein
MSKRILGLILALTFGTSLANASDGTLRSDAKGLLTCMANNLPTALRIQHLEIVATSRDGFERRMSGRLFALREDDGASSAVRAMLRIDAPDAHADTAYLMRGDLSVPPSETYVYLPAIRRVRQITGSFADGPFLASDFSYREFRMMLGVFDDGEIRIEGSEMVDGRKATRMTFVPPADMVTPYREVWVWLDEASCLPLKAEFRQGDIVRKRFSVDAESLTHATDHQYATVSRMDDLVEGSHTVIRVLGVVQQAELPDHLFEPDAFYRVP